MKVKDNKLVECSKKEYEVIKKIYKNSTCLACAVDNVITYFFHESKAPIYALKNVASNMILAVINDYKYLKVID